MNVNAFLAIGAVLAVILPVVIVLMENEAKNAPPKPTVKTQRKRGKRAKKWVDDHQSPKRQDDFVNGHMRDHANPTYLGNQDAFHL